MKQQLLKILISLWILSHSSWSHAGLVAFYTFEGNSNDVSGNGYHGTVSGATLTNTGFEGQAYDFDGLNDFISIAVDINPTVIPQLTIGAWVNSNVANSTKAIISHDNAPFDRGIGIDQRGPGSSYRYSTFTGSGVSSAGDDPLHVDEWYFVSARYNETIGSFSLDVNGNRITGSSSFGGGFNTTRIGSNPGFGEYFDGLIDNVFIYDEFLSDSEIDNIRLHGASEILGETVPEPAVIWLISFSLIGFVGMKKKSVKLSGNHA